MPQTIAAGGQQLCLASAKLLEIAARAKAKALPRRRPTQRKGFDGTKKVRHVHLFVANMLDQLVIPKKQQKPKKSQQRGRPTSEGPGTVSWFAVFSFSLSPNSEDFFEGCIQDDSKAWITGAPAVKVSAWDNECAEAVR